MTILEAPQGVGRIAGLRYGSPWFPIDQPLINAFADTTGDRQYIHVDPDRAAATPLGGTIAHGFLLLSLLPHLHAASDKPEVPALSMAINYGFDRIRFISPVCAGARVRAHFTIAELTEKRPGEWQQVLDVEMQVEGGDKPVLAARWISRLVLADGVAAGASGFPASPSPPAFHPG